MSNLHDKWICTHTISNNFKVGKVYGFNSDGNFVGEDRVWVLRPKDFAQASFRKITISDYYEQIHNLHRRKGK